VREKNREGGVSNKTMRKSKQDDGSGKPCGNKLKYTKISSVNKDETSYKHVEVLQTEGNKGMQSRWT